MEQSYEWRDCNGKTKAHFMLMKQPLCVAACGFHYAPVLVLKTANRERCQACEKVYFQLGFGNPEL